MPLHTEESYRRTPQNLLLTFFVAQLLIGRALPSPGRSVFSCRHSWQVLHLDQRYYMYAYVSLEMFIIDSVEWLMVRYYGEGAPSGMDQTGVQIKTWQVLLFKLFFYHAASKTSQWHRPKDAEVGIDTSNATLALRASFFIYAGLCLNSIDWLLKYCISNIILWTIHL